jgi:hypothetical protein
LQQASSREQREAESLPDGGGAADQAKSRPGGGAADQEQSEWIQTEGKVYVDEHESGVRTT